MSKKTAQLIDGKKLADDILYSLKEKIADLPHAPGLAVVMIGDDAASKLYIQSKKKASQKIGVTFHDYYCGGEHMLPNITEAEVLTMIEYLNQDEMVHGIIVQLPIPKSFDTNKIIAAIAPEKDVDGFHPQNQGEALHEKLVITSPLIHAVEYALAETKEKLTGKRCVIVSKNPIFSTPLKKALEALGLKTEVTKPENDLKEKTLVADVLISVVGKKGLITKDMVKPDSIIIDVGTNLVSANTWVGDVDLGVSEVAGWLTPVPGGIGPLTVAMLLQNTYDAAVKNQRLKTKD